MKRDFFSLGSMEDFFIIFFLMFFISKTQKRVSLRACGPLNELLLNDSVVIRLLINSIYRKVCGISTKQFLVKYQKVFTEKKNLPGKSFNERGPHIQQIVCITCGMFIQEIDVCVLVRNVC
jgi:hypothetical protein